VVWEVAWGHRNQGSTELGLPGRGVGACGGCRHRTEAGGAEGIGRGRLGRQTWPTHREKQTEPGRMVRNDPEGMGVPAGPMFAAMSQNSLPPPTSSNRHVPAPRRYLPARAKKFLLMSQQRRRIRGAEKEHGQVAGRARQCEVVRGGAQGNGKKAAQRECRRGVQPKSRSPTFVVLKRQVFLPWRRVLSAAARRCVRRSARKHATRVA